MKRGRDGETRSPQRKGCERTHLGRNPNSVTTTHNVPPVSSSPLDYLEYVVMDVDVHPCSNRPSYPIGYPFMKGDFTPAAAS